MSPDPSSGGPVAVSVRGLRCAYGAAEVLHGVDLDVRTGEVLSVLGPSGCGKTTLLRCIAGLERPTAGTIEVGGQQVCGPGRWVLPRRRGLGMVFQDGALFPHLSVAENVAFGLGRAPGRRARVEELLDLVGLSGTGDRSPGTLSGGQQQRVALARALAPSPAVLLLDEPFSSLDATLRVQVRGEVERILHDVGVTAVFVTHDQEEAFEVGDRIAVLRDGHLEQLAPVRDLYLRPANEWVAGFVGEANLLPGIADGATATTAVGPVPLLEPAQGEVIVLVRPEELVIGPTSASEPTAALGGRPGRVRGVRYRGHDSLIDVLLDDGTQVLVRRAGDPGTAVAAAASGGAAVHVDVRHAGAASVSWPTGR